ncbi:hypothetical protein N7450_000092 [Penicillium hetheringtonii]|uniref:D-isomer specific 2-hydroxyacid dehydrogenase NAD-binding domain-containing protein n=1 Tax=Penicillium hetheringtonii TaxID=911720 RepID=A0AAD6H288_9EURO|nr:hypothetical protein N7450_000092 [Penicillium hetheringtonii]
MLKFAILDDYQGIAPAHFAHLESRIEIVSFPKTLDPRDPTQHAELIQRLLPFDVILAMRERTPFGAETIAALPNLKLLLTTGMRNLSLDIQTFTDRGILSCWHGGTSTWCQFDGATYLGTDPGPGPTRINLSGKTLALLGLGKLGSQVGKIAVQAFGMNVLAWSANLTQEKADEQAEAQGLPAGSFQVASSKTDFFARADVLSMHNVLSERSRGIVSHAELATMKPSAMIVNTSRGPLIDESALLQALNAGAIRGAALDVFEPEPLPLDSPWRTTAWGRDGRSEVVLSPHMGYGEEDLLNGWYRETAENLERWLDGKELLRKMN